MAYRIIDKEQYYRKGVFRHFTEDCKCSVSMTSRIDVTSLVQHSHMTGTQFYINFLYLLSRVLNARDDYRMGYLRQTDELICYDVIHPTQYVFHDDTETCTPVYSFYDPRYDVFYRNAAADIARARQTREYNLDAAHHPNWFDASYIPWASYDALHVELPDGYLYFAPIVNWGRYREEDGRQRMPVTVRMNHAVADGYLVAAVFRMLETEIQAFCRRAVVETPRLTVRAVSVEDMRRFIGQQTDSVLTQAYSEMLQGCTDHPEQWMWHAIWMIERKDGTRVGDLSFKGLRADGSAEIGYGVDEAYRGCGYASEAVGAVVEWALRQPGVTCVQAETEPNNTASQRVLEKCGFAPSGMLGEEGPRFVREH